MRIAPNAKCQRVLELALWFVASVSRAEILKISGQYLHHTVSLYVQAVPEYENFGRPKGCCKVSNFVKAHSHCRNKVK